MKGQSLLGGRVAARASKLGAAGAVGVAVVGLSGVSGCLNRPIEPIDPVETFTIANRLTQSAVNKIDLLFMIDNSSSMADKQQVLSTAVPDLISGLVNPPCVDAMTGVALPAAMQPATSLLACPANAPDGAKREFPPIYDIHIGLISSSLGTFGANGCPDSEPTCPGMAPNTSLNDHGHLVTRTDPCSGMVVPTYTVNGMPEDFLAWDPKQMLTPPGIADESTIETSLQDLVIGNGQSGCGFESQNEAWYRFLVDPSPYQMISLSGPGSTVATAGMDEVLLTQRNEFMRSDSLLAIIMLSDETDTSIKEYGQYPLFAQETTSNNQPFHLPHGRQECTDASKGPADPCCLSCGEHAPASCPADPTCVGAAGTYNGTNENLGLRAFGLSGWLMSHKARYGIEWFYQPSRYVQALTSPTVQNSEGDMVTNPIFKQNPTEPMAGVRDPGLVFYAAITGVPWQLIARQDNASPSGMPDLINGVDALDKTQVGGFKTYEELLLKDSHGNTFWDDIVGDPENYVYPFSPYMQENTGPRMGTDPITGIAISPPTSPNGTNPLNGHEWIPSLATGVQAAPGDIEYACVFTLPTPKDCTVTVPCDCTVDAMADNPLCDPNPNDNMKPSLQTRAKAYPGVKNLAIAKGLESQGIAASICPAQLTDNTQPDYGYRPAVNAIINRLKQALAGECLQSTLTPCSGGLGTSPTCTEANPNPGEVPCLVVEARNTGSGACPCGPCTSSSDCGSGFSCVGGFCTGGARAPVSLAGQSAVVSAKADPLAQTAGWNCFCEITQAGTAAPGESAADAAADLVACQGSVADPPINAADNQTVNGWCYVDDSGAEPVGNPKIVENCPATEKRLIRFVGAGQSTPGATLFITCEGQ